MNWREICQKTIRAALQPKNLARELNIPLDKALEAITLYKVLHRNRLQKAPASGLERDPLYGFMEFALPRASSSRAQIFQDLWVLWELNSKQSGYFVEFGAADGTSISNTLLLEKRFGWSGICAEPNPIYHKRLVNRRSCHVSKKCVYSKRISELKFHCTENAEYSRVAEEIPNDGHESSNRSKYKQIMVEAITLNDLLDEYKAPEQIDYISIDTEGSELAILEAFNFSKRLVSCFSIEHNFTSIRSEIHAILTKNGYERRFPSFTRFDDWYVHKSQISC